ncbi:aspartate aminotransferase family protein [Pseudooceanicola nanhaiensis]|jgi:4-aminobutyrate--pyruvate transaminase|uniref:Aspartate aminotransferase family protein n=1 Tax=Pseudooceanicola nanhaiensis TaxID=375761 RepID=A0A917T5F7_9RHOB|nr:aspartate aminotransferase family protein [Pseudooceanicola nanhaiensis]GGM10013.1 aspartate aminotransferase family protein [Pseudooceanicola nanhaiensis]
MNHLPNSIEARDAAVHMHPYTDARALQQNGPTVMAKGEGVHVWDTNGKQYIEAMAGLWSVGIGFSEPRLVEAAAKQMAELPYYHTFAMRSHTPAIELAEKLIGMAPKLENPMSKVFFTNSGSEANDTVVKMIWYRANAMGQPQRKKIISRIKGYHGITIASGSMTGLPANHGSFDLPLPGFLHTGSPHHWREAADGESEEDFSKRRAQELEEMILAEGPDTIAAFIGEPVMGAGGVIVPPKGYWAEIQKVLKKYDILLIADEVINGLGRTGNMWGSETCEMQPDIMVSSKQLSSSYLPISAIMLNDKVFEPIADESNRIGTFGHGFTGGGHPVAAAVALENLKIIEERDLLGNVREVGPYMQEKLGALTAHPLVGEKRGIGLIAALELVTDKQAKTALEKPGALGARVGAAVFEAGLICRNMGDALAFCPPMIITKPQIDELVGKVEGALDQVAGELGL